MTTLGDTYKLAFVKQGSFIGGVGRFIAGAPFFLAGMAGVQKLFGKKPKVERMYIPREDYAQLVNPQAPPPRQRRRQAPPQYQQPTREHWSTLQRAGY
jgi:hypothetical protein